MVLNPHYNELTGAANALQDVVKVNNSLVLLGVSPPFSPAELKNAVTARELAYNTTSLTYCVFKLYVDIPKLKAQSKQKTDAVALREALKLKLFTIPPSLERKLTAFETGMPEVRAPAALAAAPPPSKPQD